MHKHKPHSILKTTFVCCLLVTFFTSIAQEPPNTVIAKTGDGIFSILRKSGIHPVKYYEQFLSLNVERVKNGSELVVGEEYILPNAPDSFKQTGIRIDTGEGFEGPIFNERQLSLMNLKDTTLQNTVYYFVYSGGVDSKKRFDDLSLQLANDLMVKGARVYLMQDSKTEGMVSDSLSLSDKKEVYGNYSSAINKKYLRHNGTYQRVILIEDTFGKHQKSSLSISHNATSKEGRQFASILSQVLKKNAKVPSRVTTETNPFKDEASIFLANNLVPPVIILNFVKDSSPIEARFNLKAEKKPLVGLLSEGIMEDYSHLHIEN